MRWACSAVLVCAIGASHFQSGYANDSAGSNPASVDDVLNHWETASRRLLGVGPMELRRLYELHQAAYSAHEISLLNEFRGPVSAGDLKQRFVWSFEKRGEQIVIVGLSQDPLEQLFFRQVTVALDSRSHLPKSVQFANPNSQKIAEVLAVVPSPKWPEPNRFWPDENARPLRYAFTDEHPNHAAPVRVVEHVTLMSVPRSELPRDVARLLEAWETSAGKIQSLTAKIDRQVFEAGHQVEHRASGDFFYAFPPVVRCSLKPTTIPPMQLSQRRSAAGVPYELLPSPEEHWEYTPTEIRFFPRPGEAAIVFRAAGDKANPIQLANHERPVDGSDAIIPPWRMLFSPSAAQLSARFEIRVNHQVEPMAIEFLPKRRDDAGRFGLMRVYLDYESWLPKTVQFLNPQRDSETVYTFRQIRIQKHAPSSQAPKLLPVKNEPAKRLPAPASLNGQP